MISTIHILVYLLIAIAAVAFLAKRLKVPSAILMVLTGVGAALIPGLPTVELAPDFVLLLVLPPIIYSSAVAMSWREFRFSLRPITMLAGGCVLFTTVAVAAASHWFLGFPWPVGFVLGAIVSPPDAVAPLSIVRRLGLPRRIAIILEGEGLANDATALILYRFAIAAVSTGVFSMGQAAGTFAVIVVGEVCWGIGVGWLMLRLRRWVGDPRIELLLSIVTPFLAYWLPEHLGGSGVLATVTTGLYISWNGFRLISSATRLQGIFFWDLLIYVMEGMVFLLTGLQARKLMAGISTYSISELLTSAALVSAVVIVTRFVWMYPGTYLPRWLVPALARKDPSPPWQWPFVLAFTGVRGIVSLAAALAIPFTLQNGQPFPHRDLILFLTFCVILVTLVGQGLLLPLVIPKLGLAKQGLRERRADRAKEYTVRRQAIEAAIERLDRLAVERKLPDDIVTSVRTFHRDRIKHIENLSGNGDRHRKLVALSGEIQLALIAAERQAINELYRNGAVKDEARRRIEHELDLREAHLASVQAEE
jgi:Na+/H+ antiporter